MHLICCKILRGEPFSPLNCPHSTVVWEGKNNKTCGQLMKTQGWERGQGTNVPTGSTEKKSQVQIRDFDTSNSGAGLLTGDMGALRSLPLSPGWIWAHISHLLRVSSPLSLAEGMMVTIPSIDACIPLRVYWMRNENDVLIMQEATGLAFSHNKNIPSFSRSDWSNSRTRGKHSHHLFRRRKEAWKTFKRRKGGVARVDCELPSWLLSVIQVWMALEAGPEADDWEKLGWQTCRWLRNLGNLRVKWKGHGNFEV